MNDAAIVHALAATAAWSETILWPLRTVRRELAGFSEIAVEDRQSMKHALLSIELEAERISQRKTVASLELLIGGLSAEPARKIAAIGLDLYAIKLHASALQDKADFDAILNAL